MNLPSVFDFSQKPVSWCGSEQMAGCLGATLTDEFVKCHLETRAIGPVDAQALRPDANQAFGRFCCR